MTVEEWLLLWIQEYKKRSVKLSTYRRYIDTLKLEIAPLLGHYKLKDLKIEIVQRFINQLSDKGLSHSTIRKAHETLRGALSQAVENGLIAKNVALNCGCEYSLV